MKKSFIDFTEEVFCDLTGEELEERFEFVSCKGFSVTPCAAKVSCDYYNCPKLVVCNDQGYSICQYS